MGAAGASEGGRAAEHAAEHAAETLQALRFGETAAAVDLGAKDVGADRAAAAALASLDAQISSLEERRLLSDEVSDVMRG